ncbi:hypothetical protein J5N97_027191 [Dioscorea zingiberensis]|uniref:Receptor-like serine/threonine-protein kinase n=1 Tax=Dioscorea zingiberensis TaxID=325984 RepID=A0A9D5C492_9LILI|nr:hypothetical protein J5N97_027191 [Dioscorea zingiberensis]
MRNFSKGQALFIILFLSTLVFPQSIIGRDTITPTQPLSSNETLVSSGGSFVLGFFTTGNSTNHYVGIWYNKISVRTYVWVANRQTPATDSSATLSISTNNGSLIISHQNSTAAVWNTPTNSLSNPVAKLLDDGNLVVVEDGSDFNDNRSYVWQGFDHPTDTLLPGMKLGLNLTSGLNSNLTCWKSDVDPGIGPCTLAMDIRGSPQLAFWSGSKRGWRSGPWTGDDFSGIPETRTHTMLNFHFVNNKQEVFYWYAIRDPSFITRLVMNQSSVLQRFVWLDDSDQWSIYWHTPKTQCDYYGPCGPYGSCDLNSSPVCRCLPGFMPKSQREWEVLRQGSGGCVRKTQLDCRNNTDGFMMVSNASVPDTVNVTVDMSKSLAECRDMCLMNCSCTGYANADVRNGGTGCITWAGELLDMAYYIDGGQDFYVRLAAADLSTLLSQSKSGKKRNDTIIIVVCVLLGLLILICLAAYAWRKKRRQGSQFCWFSTAPDSSDEQCMVERSETEDLELPLFDFDMVAAATNNFSFQNKLGEGGFGPVYRGRLDDGQEIAVKTLSKTSIQGSHEFKNEVILIAKLQHRNLVRLLGCCIQGEERILIYEYLPNKSLDAFLFDKERNALLDWRTRYRIIEGIARGLLYLHQDSRFRIIHRDLKASNILLDGEMNPKISDFGMARIFGGDQTKAMTLRVVGTYGYMSPEYAMDGIFSVKSDVFSFGVLMLEIISGTRNKGVYLSDPDQYLLGRAWSLWREGNALQLVDSSIGHLYPMDEVLRCIKIGLLCVQEHPEDRPIMSSVGLMLASENAAIPQPKQPGFILRKGYSEADSSSSKLDFQSGNDLTFTMSTGR